MANRKEHSSEKRYLTLKHNTWYLHKAVPTDLVEHYCKKTISISLKTSDLRLARSQRDQLLKILDDEFNDLKSGLKAKPLSKYDELVQMYQDAYSDRPRLADGRYDIEDHETILIGEEAEGLIKQFGLEKAKEFYDISTGRGAGIGFYIDTWDKQLDVSYRTSLSYKQALNEFIERDIVETINNCDRQKAGMHIEHLLDKGLARKTINKKISAICCYWKWLIKRGHAQDNPWKEQHLAVNKNRAHTQSEKSPWSDDEVSELLQRAPNVLLKDVMGIGVFSGMRINEICNLKVTDCLHNYFDVVTSKTKAGIRRVPIHNSLVELVARRCRGKRNDDYLFDELDSNKRSDKVQRSDPLSKRFGRYHRKLFGDQRVQGQRQSPKDFHSFRRWFITKAEEAGQPPWTIASVVGHERTGMTLSVYSAGPSMDQLRECVEAVKLKIDN